MLESRRCSYATRKPLFSHNPFVTAGASYVSLGSNSGIPNGVGIGDTRVSFELDLRQQTDSFLPWKAAAFPFQRAHSTRYPGEHFFFRPVILVRSVPELYFTLQSETVREICSNVDITKLCIVL